MGNLFIENQTHYDLFDTADGSPSICLSSDKFRPEAMHHRQGALAESLFVYHGVLSEALRRECPPKILSVGLGCGYNELITIAHFMTLKKPFPLEFYLESFEGDENLRLGFTAWLINEKLPSPLGRPLFTVFDRVCDLVAKSFSISTNDLKKIARDLIERKQFHIREWLQPGTAFTHLFGVIYFDAFSGKSTPELWSESFLIDLLNKVAAPKCGLATYAATGALNRALKKSNFALEKQAGFSGKRESTRAFRT